MDPVIAPNIMTPSMPGVIYVCPPHNETPISLQPDESCRNISSTNSFVVCFSGRRIDVRSHKGFPPIVAMSFALILTV
jgi:hypothetical protein